MLGRRPAGPFLIKPLTHLIIDSNYNYDDISQFRTGYPYPLYHSVALPRGCGGFGRFGLADILASPVLGERTSHYRYKLSGLFPGAELPAGSRIGAPLVGRNSKNAHRVSLHLATAC